MKPLDEAAEAAHRVAMREVAYEAMQQLRDTISPNFNPVEIGYDSADQARLVIVQFAVKRMNALSAAHLKKVGR